MNILRSAITLAAPLCALFILSACETTAPLPAGNGSYSVASGHEYKLGPGDKLRVTVFGEQQLSGDFMVANNGAVAMPLVGEIKAGGNSPEAFQTAVQDKLTETGMVRTPRVSVDVLAYRPFYILGEVTKPGQYEYAVGMTLTKAVATAGGFTYRADSKVVFVTREGTAQEQPVAVTAASWIGPGDTIRIAERYF